jgi:serine/threonine-protein kinase
MSLGPGRRLGPYEVLGALGSGGMGEVWRARDTRLGRDVALKVLPDDLAGSAERRSRLEHEARLLASLNHPSIAALHDVLDDEGSPVLVMEVVEGETLAERLSRGPLLMKTALALAFPIAEALEAAHERGILHRDLKPSNVKLTPDGGVKVLDFGLAKALESEDGEFFSAAATLPKRVEKTASGAAIGTAPYMSPEQARGERVDKRTDVWAFGCILFEMLTGRRAFPGATRSDSIAAVLAQEPDWGSLPRDTPSNLQRVLKRCLQKDPKERLRDIADIKLELRDLLAEISAGRISRLRWKTVPAATLVAVALAAAAAALWLLRPKVPPAETRMPRFQLSLPRGVDVRSSGQALAAISPDGKNVVFVGCRDMTAHPSVSGLDCLLYLRDQSELDARPLPGTEGATCPFFSPDGRFVAFGAQRKLKKIDLQSDAVVVLTDAPACRGGSWGEDGTILFSRGGGGLLRVSAEGGEVQEVTKLDADRKENDHRWPHVLPGARAALFQAMSYEFIVAVRGSLGHDVAVVDLETGRKRILIESAGNPRYLSGHLLFGRDGIVYSAPFDLERLELTSSPVPVLEGVSMWSSPGMGRNFLGNVQYDVARDGTMLFSPREARLPRRTLVSVDRNGRREPVSRLQRAYDEPFSVSPDGRHVAVSVQKDVGSPAAFLLDIESGAWTRVGEDLDLSVLGWTPDSNHLLLYGRSPDLRLLLAPVDGSESPRTVHVGQVGPLTVAPDGTALLFTVQSPILSDLSRLTLADQRAEPWLATPSDEGFASFSPDGLWVAYSSDDSGRSEIYVRAYSGSGGRHAVSTEGGGWPRWSADGREIFFLSEGSLWSAAVRTAPDFASEPPQKLFAVPDEIVVESFYEVFPDGQRFLMIEKDPFELRPGELVVVPGWVEEMKARVAAAK